MDFIGRDFAVQKFQPKSSLRSNLLVVRVMAKDTKWVL